ncbi:DUF4145 domain-containing protein [Bacillus spizizenii]|nr:DUF4145 domain-containing protein [Bacillus spizizenii]
MTENIILVCPHCGNKTPMKLLNKFEKKTEYPETDYVEIIDIFEIFECPVCKEFHLYYTYWSSEDSYFIDHDIYEDGQVLYPYREQLNLHILPKNIKAAYESALKVRKIDPVVCLMALRRTLEMVCKDKGANGRTLHAKLDELEEKNVLPPLMGDISQVIKEAGNVAAHGDDIEFNSHMVEPLFKFTNKILEYIYILPSEMKSAKRQMELLTGKQIQPKEKQTLENSREAENKESKKDKKEE